MKILLNTILAGPNGNFGPGEVSVSDELGRQLIASGFAKKIGDNESHETDAAGDVENASIEPEAAAVMPRRGRPRKV